MDSDRNGAGEFQAKFETGKILIKWPGGYVNYPMPANPDEQPLDLDYETAPMELPRPTGYRRYVGGLLAVEGIVVLLMGMTMLAGYGLDHGGQPGNPIGRFAGWMVAAALVYMIAVAVGLLVHRWMRPFPPHTIETVPSSGVVQRAQRYACMKRRTYYIFDNTIQCAQDAEDAWQARNLY